MNFGPYLLPVARRTDGRLRRYVRSEFKERNEGWFAANCVGRSCLTLPGEAQEPERVAIEEPMTVEVHGPRTSNCPVLNALAESSLLSDLSPRGELSGRR